MCFIKQVSIELASFPTRGQKPAPDRDPGASQLLGHRGAQSRRMKGSGCGAGCPPGCPNWGCLFDSTCRLQSDPGILTPPLYRGSLERRLPRLLWL